MKRWVIIGALAGRGVALLAVIVPLFIARPPKYRMKASAALRATAL